MGRKENLTNQLSFNDVLFPEQAIDYTQIPDIEYPEACRITLDQYFKYAKHGLSPRKLSQLPNDIDEDYIQKKEEKQKKELNESTLIGIALHNLRDLIQDNEFASVNDLLLYMNRKNGQWLPDLANLKSKKKGNMAREEETTRREIARYYANLDYAEDKDRAIIIFTALAAIRLLLEKLNFYEKTQHEVSTAVNLHPYYTSGKRFVKKAPIALVIDRVTPTGIIEDKTTFPRDLRAPILQLAVGRFAFVPLTARKFNEVRNYEERTIKELNETIVHLNERGEIYSKYRQNDEQEIFLEIYSLATGEKVRLKYANFSTLIQASLHANEFMLLRRSAGKAATRRNNRVTSCKISENNYILDRDLRMAYFNLNYANHLLEVFFNSLELEAVEAMIDNQTIAKKYLGISTEEMKKCFTNLKIHTGIDPFLFAAQAVDFRG